MYPRESEYDVYFFVVTRKTNESEKTTYSVNEQDSKERKDNAF